MIASLRAGARELQAFVRAALVDPVAREQREADHVLRRRRWVAFATLVVGTGVLGWTLRIQPGDPLFYLAGALLAIVWAGGAVLSGALRLGRARTRSGRATALPIVQSLALGTLLLGIFLAGATVVAQVPFLRAPVDALLDHAQLGSLAVVALITTVNGIAEELYFRGALYAAVNRRFAVVITTIAYTAVTVFTGVPLLVLAAFVLGLITGLQRRVTGGILGPTVTHLVWSLGMLFLLPVVLASVG